MEYQYPISIDWSKEEIVDVIAFFQMIEKAYEKGVGREPLLESYSRFKTIVPSKSEENNYCKEFEEVSGYSAYHVIKKGKQALPEVVIRMNE